MLGDTSSGRGSPTATAHLSPDLEAELESVFRRARTRKTLRGAATPSGWPRPSPWSWPWSAWTGCPAQRSPTPWTNLPVRALTGQGSTTSRHRGRRPCRSRFNDAPTAERPARGRRALRLGAGRRRTPCRRRAEDPTRRLDLYGRPPSHGDPATGPTPAATALWPRPGLSTMPGSRPAAGAGSLRSTPATWSTCPRRGPGPGSVWKGMASSTRCQTGRCHQPQMDRYGLGRRRRRPAPRRQRHLRPRGLLAEVDELVGMVEPTSS